MNKKMMAVAAVLVVALGAGTGVSFAKEARTVKAGKVKIVTTCGAITALDAVKNTVTVKDSSAVEKTFTAKAAQLKTLKVGDTVTVRSAAGSSEALSIKKKHSACSKKAKKS